MDEYLVRPKTQEWFKAIKWYGTNGEEIQTWITNNDRLNDYDVIYSIFEDTLWEGHNPLPVNTWLVLDESIQHYSPDEFAEYFEFECD